MVVYLEEAAVPAKAFYDQAFYARQSKRSESSAHAILPLLFTIYWPNSVVDFGCGVGTWLKAAFDLGIVNLRGFEGPWVSHNQMLIREIKFFNANIADRIETQRADLALCLEVAEHIQPEKAVVLIDNLCRASDVVLFSAAIPRQGGIGHLNERLQSYWAELFAAQGYDVFDVIRPHIWNDTTIRFWYRQNILLFVKRTSTAIDRTLLFKRQAPILDVVHPEMNAFHARDANSSLRRLVRALRFRLTRRGKSH